MTHVYVPGKRTRFSSTNAKETRLNVFFHSFVAGQHASLITLRCTSIALSRFNVLIFCRQVYLKDGSYAVQMQSSKDTYLMINIKFCRLVRAQEKNLFTFAGVRL